MGLTNNLGKLSNMITSTGSAVGIAQASPSYTLDVTGTGRTTTGTYLATSSGNVGIGTTSPYAIATGRNVTIEDSTNNDIALSFGLAGTRTAQIYTSGLQFRLSAVTNIPMLFFTNDTEKMRITAGGNVGIGTTSPGDILDVQKNQNATTTFYFRNTDTTSGASRAKLSIIAGSSQLELLAINGDNTYIGGTVGKDMYFQQALGGTVNMIIKSSGNVGIATTSPAALLSLKGRGGADIIFQMNDETDTRRCFYIPNQYYGYMWAVGVVSNGGKAYSFGNASGTEVGTIVINAGGVAYNTTSDYRLKEDFRDFSGLDKVSKIKVYDFKWKNLDERIDGVIAHELAEVLPYAVSGVKDALNHEGNIEAQSVDYSKLTPVLVKAIQELSAKVLALENK